MLMKMAKYSVKMGLGYFAMGTKDGNLNFIFNSIQLKYIIPTGCLIESKEKLKTRDF